MNNSTNKPLKKTTPNPPPRPQQPTKYVAKKFPLLELPTSPQLIVGEEILHFSHPQHPLSVVDLRDDFTCAGCKEYGAGKRFFCPQSQCDHRLHDFCALAPPTFNTHPLHPHHQLGFHSKPVKGFLQSKCDVCEKPAKGYNYQCSSCSFQMHTSCAMLSNEIHVPAHMHALRLVPARNGDLDNNFLCGECKRKRSGRVYRCVVCDYHLHAVCAKNMINGLYANGIRDKEKPGMLGTAANIASKVVVEFIGGLMEGLGEGVGQVIVQSTARGDRGRMRP